MSGETNPNPPGETVRRFPLGRLLPCPICGSSPRRSRRRGDKSVVCFAGSHRLESFADTQIEADKLWNTTTEDWAARQDREAQVEQSLKLLEVIASMNHIAQRVDNGLNTHAAQLRECARILRAALSATLPTEKEKP